MTLHSYGDKIWPRDPAISFPRLPFASLSCDLHLCKKQVEPFNSFTNPSWDMAYPASITEK